jgi:hypothetical protein
MRNKLTDLNNYLFEQLERLNDDELTDDELKKEIVRAKAVTDTAQSIIQNANTILSAARFLEEGGNFSYKSEAVELLGGCDGGRIK